MGLTRNKTVREKQGSAGAIGCSVRLGGAGWVGYVISYFIPRYPIDLLYIYLITIIGILTLVFHKSNAVARTQIHSLYKIPFYTRL